MRTRNFVFVFIFILLVPTICLAAPDSLTVRDISIQGNDKTIDKIILRELSFEKNQKIPNADLDTLVEKNERNVFNTSLFLKVEISYQVAGAYIDFNIHVKERWYIFVFPRAELADRSFNEWWVDRDHELNRIELGLMLNKYNVRGRNEFFTASFQTGFSSKFNFLYQIPFIDKTQKTGIDLSLFYEQNSEVPYGVNQKNRLQYYDADGRNRQRLISEFKITRRNRINDYHSIIIGFENYTVTDTVIDLNPKYLGSGLNEYRFFSLKYQYLADYTDIRYYPKRGYFVQALLAREGLGLFDYADRFRVNVQAAFYKGLFKKLFFGTRVYFELSTENQETYMFSPVLGFEEIFPRTYEYYLMYGSYYFLGRNELKYQLIERSIYLPFLKKFKKFNNIPIDLYFKGFADIAYVNSKYEMSAMDFSNEFLYGLGCGFDFVSYYDIVFRFETGFNHKKEPGFFLHMEKGL